MYAKDICNIKTNDKAIVWVTIAVLADTIAVLAINPKKNVPITIPIFSFEFTSGLPLAINYSAGD